ncbi:MAG: aldo/keto reductase, partial [Flavobacteriaceae bacterium]|nr:aldo/keto reductase [Flavobacteriaceae bacterium]
MLNRSQLSKIGIGTWGIGGYMERDSSVDQEKQIDAIVYQLKKGINIIQANEIYSQGTAVDFIGKAISQSQVTRDKLFIIQANYRDSANLELVENELDRVMKTLNTNYIDTFQFRGRAFSNNDFDDLSKTVDALLSKNKILKTSITNMGLDLLKKYHQRFGDSLFSIEICHNFEIRENEKAGIIKYAKDNNIEIFIFQPLRRNRTAQHNWPLLVSLADKYNVTQN